MTKSRNADRMNHGTTGAPADEPADEAAGERLVDDPAGMDGVGSERVSRERALRGTGSADPFMQAPESRVEADSGPMRLTATRSKRPAVPVLRDGQDHFRTRAARDLVAQIRAGASADD